MTARPPRVGCWLVQLWRRTTRRHDIARDVEDDLLELFEIRARDRGPRFAARRYILDALSLWRCRTLPETIDDHARYRGDREMLQDIRFAARLFRRQPGLFGMTVAGLALAIGISTAVFSTVKAVAFSGYGISDPESVYRIALNGARFSKPTGPVFQGNWPFADYQRLHDEAPSLTLVASASDGARYAASADATNVPAVTLLRSPGRTSRRSGCGRRSAACSRPLMTCRGRRPRWLAMVSGRTASAADAAIVGRTVWLNGHAFTVVGVADRAARQPRLDRPGRRPSG